ncbi:MAG TPA: TIGR04076 family protein [Candidatus Aminicenantes bacterium]|nr:TIGR04076 family protein [Candidatus Aminicenantes bacterium]
MNRRLFIRNAAAVSAGAAAAMSAPGRLGAQADKKSYGCRLTVLERMLRQDYADKYRGGRNAVCDRFKDGQTFLTNNPWEMPAGFCDWAWADIRVYIHDILSGMMDKNVVCCTDGFRPVFFLLERVEMPGK